jgi:Protein of unknown function (DUF3631)
LGVPEAVWDAVEQFLRRHVVFGCDEQVVACALFVLHTYAIQASEVTPYLAVTSAEKQSGKSRLLEVLEALVANPLPVVSPSAAALYRSIGASKPTLLLDEVDTIFNQQGRHEELRAVLNAGFRRGAKIPRWDMEANRIVTFDPFCAKVIAGIGQLPDTVQDRSIPIRLKRKTGGEKVQRFRIAQARAAEPLRSRITEWADAQVDTLKQATPHLPEELSDRQQDAWEPLLAIADHAADTWPERSREAAVALVATRLDGQDSLSLRLLGDLKALFDQCGASALSSADILDQLNRLDDRPWASWSNGTGLTPYRLNRLLERYDLHTKDVRRGDAILKGFRRADLEDAWERWLPKTATPTPATAATSRHLAGDTPTQNSTPIKEPAF